MVFYYCEFASYYQERKVLAGAAKEINNGAWIFIFVSRSGGMERLTKEPIISQSALKRGTTIWEQIDGNYRRSTVPYIRWAAEIFYWIRRKNYIWIDYSLELAGKRYAILLKLSSAINCKCYVDGCSGEKMDLPNCQEKISEHNEKADQKTTDMKKAVFMLHSFLCWSVLAMRS